jgi:hypothetical protein
LPQYIPAFVSGGTFFFTLARLERRRKLLTENTDVFGIVQVAKGGMRFAFPPYGPNFSGPKRYPLPTPPLGENSGKFEKSGVP